MTSNNHTPIAVGAPANAGIINNPLGQLDAAIGKLADLDTAAKNNIVDAINEVFAGAEPAQAKNMFKASPAAASGVPGYRTIVTADLPTIGTSGTYTKVTTDATGRVVSGTGVDVSDVLNLGTKRLDEWAAPLDSTVLDASTSKHGLMAKYPNTPTSVLIGNGTWRPWAMGVQNNVNLLTARKYLNIFGNGVSVIDRGASLDRIDVNIAGASAVGLGKPFFPKQTKILAEIDYEDSSSPISVVTNPTTPYPGTVVSEFYTPASSALKWLEIMPAGGFSCYMKGSIASDDPDGKFIIIIDAVDNVGATLGTVGTIIVPVTVTTEEWFYGGGSVVLTDFGVDFDRLRITVYASSGIANTMTLETNLGCSYIVTTYRNIGEKGDTGVTGATGVTTAHNLLSATHSDTSASTPADGDIIVADNGAWDNLAAGSPGQILRIDGTIMPAWATENGWIPFPKTATYASASTFTVPGDYTAIFTKGLKIRFVQTTAKYGHVASSTYSSGSDKTTVTIVTNTSYTIANATIDSLDYTLSCPIDFPEWFNYAPSETGWSSGPDGVFRYNINGRICTVNYVMTSGTSDATNASIGLPIVAATISSGAWMGANGAAYDNDVAVTVATRWLINSGTSAVSFYKDMGTGAWTSSGSKRINGVLSYEI